MFALLDVSHGIFAAHDHVYGVTDTPGGWDTVILCHEPRGPCTYRAIISWYNTSVYISNKIASRGYPETCETA